MHTPGSGAAGAHLSRAASASAAAFCLASASPSAPLAPSSLLAPLLLSLTLPLPLLAAVRLRLRCLACGLAPLLLAALWPSALAAGAGEALPPDLLRLGWRALPGERLRGEARRPLSGSFLRAGEADWLRLLWRLSLSASLSLARSAGVARLSRPSRPLSLSLSPPLSLPLSRFCPALCPGPARGTRPGSCGSALEIASCPCQPPRWAAEGGLAPRSLQQAHLSLERLRCLLGRLGDRAMRSRPCALRSAMAMGLLLLSLPCWAPRPGNRTLPAPD